MDYQEFLETLPDEGDEPWVGEARLAGAAIKSALAGLGNEEKIVLFLGAGTCGHACAVGAAGHKVMAIEIAQQAVRVANERVRKNSLGAKVIPIWEAYEKLKFDPETFDLVVAERGVFSLIETPEKAAAELARVAKKGARIIVTLFKRSPDWQVKLNQLPSGRLAELFGCTPERTENGEAACLVFEKG